MQSLSTLVRFPSSATAFAAGASAFSTSLQELKLQPLIYALLTKAPLRVERVRMSSMPLLLPQ